MRNDLAVVDIHAGIKFVLAHIQIELGEVCSPLLVACGSTKVAFQHVSYLSIAHPEGMPEEQFSVDGSINESERRRADCCSLTLDGKNLQPFLAGIKIDKSNL